MLEDCLAATGASSASLPLLCIAILCLGAGAMTLVLRRGRRRTAGVIAVLAVTTMLGGLSLSTLAPGSATAADHCAHGGGAAAVSSPSAEPSTDIVTPQPGQTATAAPTAGPTAVPTTVPTTEPSTAPTTAPTNTPAPSPSPSCIPDDDPLPAAWQDSNPQATQQVMSWGGNEVVVNDPELYAALQRPDVQLRASIRLTGHVTVDWRVTTADGETSTITETYSSTVNAEHSDASFHEDRFGDLIAFASTDADSDLGPWEQNQRKQAEARDRLANEYGGPWNVQLGRMEERNEVAVTLTATINLGCGPVEREYTGFVQLIPA